MLKWSDNALETLSALAVITLCLVIVANIVSRELLGTGFPDAIILVRELMVAAILFPLASATISRAHVAIEFIADKFPARLNRTIAVLSALIGVLIATVLLSAGCLDLAKALRNGAHYGGDLQIPKWPSRAMFVLAFGFFWLRAVQILFIDLKAALTGAPVETEK